jgi:hypothetical protein
MGKVENLEKNRDLDVGTGLPVANATVEVTISGPETHVLSTSSSDGGGLAEASWQTQKPNKWGQGGTIPGTYMATVSGVTANGYAWGGVATSVTFTAQ